MDASHCSAHPPFVQSQAFVTHQEAVSSRYYLLRLKCPEIAARALPGQFVMLACAPDLGASCEPLLPRPLAIMDAHGGEIELLYFVAGYGTEVLRQTAERPSRAPLRIIGPLGQPFTLIDGVDAHVAVGGGSGVAPLVYFFRKTARGRGAFHLILAARSKDQLARADVINTPGTQHLATDDGSAGFNGNAIGALQHLLTGTLKGKKLAIYAAGPEPMMLAAAKLARKNGFPCRVSLEARMACGVGVCRACVVDGLTPHKKTGLLRRTVCQDGPVFDIDELAGW